MNLFRSVGWNASDSDCVGVLVGKNSFFCPTLNHPLHPHLPTHHLMPFLVSDATTFQSFDGNCEGQWLITQNLDPVEILERFADNQPRTPYIGMAAWTTNRQTCTWAKACTLCELVAIWEKVCTYKVITMAAQLTDLLVSTAEVSNLLSFLAVLGGLLVMMAFIIRMLYQVTSNWSKGGLNTLGFDRSWVMEVEWQGWPTEHLRRGCVGQPSNFSLNSFTHKKPNLHYFIWQGFCSHHPCRRRCWREGGHFEGF